MPIADLTAAFARVDVRAVLARRSTAAARCAASWCPARRGYSRKELDELVAEGEAARRGGLAWARIGEGGVQSSRAQGCWATSALRRAFDARRRRTSGDLLVHRGRRRRRWCADVLGQLRLAIAKTQNLLEPDDFEFLWVTDFPLFEWDADEQRWYPMHHPFTSPRPRGRAAARDGARARCARAPTTSCSTAREIGGGSIRIHRADVQRRIFRLLGISRRGRAGAVRLLPRRARVRHAAARRHRVRPRPHRRAALPASRRSAT